MRYCTRCLYPENHPLNIVFDSEGVCSGCRVHEEKDVLDWASRRKKLDVLLGHFRRKALSNYDCVIPIDGKDSYYTVHVIKNLYGMNPLLVLFNKHYNTLTGIRNKQYLKEVFRCDVVENTISPQLAKTLVKYELEKMGSIYWHNHLGTKTFPVQIAVRMKIPLIIWGHHQGLDQVGMFSHTDEVEMTRKYRKEHDLMGFEAEDLVAKADGLTEQELSRFFYPSDPEIASVGVRGIYLGNYLRWDCKAQHEEMIQRFEYETLAQTRNFDSYDHVDCMLYNDVHDSIKYIKWGFSKVTDHVCREIRFGRINREEGRHLVLAHSRKQTRHLNTFLRWADIEEGYFNRCIEKFRSPVAWKKNESGEWKHVEATLNELPSNELVSSAIKKLNYHSFTKQGAPSEADQFTLMHKGYLNSL